MLQYDIDREAVAVLSGSALFRGIRPEELAGELLLLGSSRRSVPEGRLLASAGDSYERLILLLAGSLLATLDDERGRSLLVAELKAPDAVAPGILFAADPRLPVSLSAKESCDVLLVRRGAVLELCRRRQRFLANLLGLLGSRIQGLAAALRTARWSPLRARLAAYLLEQAAIPHQATRGVIRLPHTREEIARLVGAERPSISRSLSALAREGFIACRGRDLTILDRSGLEHFVSG
jgi:CRP-like cAMP-binding protein